MPQIQVPQLATVTLTNAQIKALPTSAFTLVAAPGAGIGVLQLGGFAVLNNVAGAYTNVHADGFFQMYVGNNGVFPLISAAVAQAGTSGILDFADRWIYTLAPSATPGGTLYANQALTLFANNIDLGNFTGGNAANTMTVTTVYVLVDA